jgi:hypothetical protein
VFGRPKRCADSSFAPGEARRDEEKKKTRGGVVFRLQPVGTFHGSSLEQFRVSSPGYPPITYYWTVPLFLDHSYFVGNLTSSKIADTKVSGS